MYIDSVKKEWEEICENVEYDETTKIDDMCDNDKKMMKRIMKEIKNNTQDERVEQIDSVSVKRLKHHINKDVLLCLECSENPFYMLWIYEKDGRMWCDMN